MPFDEAEILGFDVSALWLQLQGWFFEHVWNAGSALQLGLIVAAMALGWLLARPLKTPLLRLEHYNKYHWLKVILRAFRAIRSAVVMWFCFMLLPLAADALGIGQGLIQLAHNLLGAWIIIRFAAAFIDNPTLARWLAAIIWSIAALDSFGWLTPLMDQLNAVGFKLGETRVTPLTIVKGLLAFAAVLWVANVLARLSETQIQRVDQLTPSLRVLISKVLRVMFIVFAIVIGLNTVGIDLTSLAVFSGAVGVGLGFGLQKVVSNFISGIILLLDRSIKPGDVIAIEDTYGWVNKLSARHVSVITRDGKEHLIPNELLITERVENWSYSDRNIRLKIPVGISYDADPREALALMKEAAAECPRILKKPEPRALMIGFGDSSVDLELRCWISDPNNGVANIKSDVLLLIWDKLHEHGIEIPFPQRDVHIKSGGVA
jgi:small-conductance mechanosensitive channel